MTKPISSFLATALLLAACQTHSPTTQPAPTPLTLSSPNSTLLLTLHPTKDGRLYYSAALNNHPVLEDAPLSISLDGHDLATSPQLLDIQNYNGTDSYPTRANHSRAEAAYNGLKLNLLDPATKTPFTLDLRAYDSGIAFRFTITTTGPHTPDEDTRFTFPPNATAWIQPVRGHYEDIPIKTPIANLKPNQFAAPPVTVQLPDHMGYASITEAAVYHYPGSALEVSGDRTFALRLAPRVPPSYPFTLRYGEEGTKRITTPVPIDGDGGGITTPWRVILIAPDLNTLVNSDILTSLNPPPDENLFPLGQQTDWIIPGRAVWNYLDGGRDTSPQGAKEFAQLGALLGFKHNVIEGYWTRWSDDELRDVCTYSAARNIHVWLWLTSDPMREVPRNLTTTTTRPAAPRPANIPETPGGPGLEPWPNKPTLTPAASASVGQPARNATPNPKFNLRDCDTRRALFSHLHDLGVSGLKIDFIDTEAQEAEDFYQDTLKDAAQFHLMVNFHGSAKPTGEQRTFPNELTREAIFGMEHRTFPQNTSAAQLHTILPFTRFLAGSADYTPVLLGPRRYNTTWSHQLATAIVFTSALQTFAAHPGNLLQLPPLAQDIIRTLPAVWDQTVVLPQSEIGQCAAYARRSGTTWYLAVLNGESPRDLHINLNFLAEGQYKADTLNDVPNNNAALTPDQKSLSRADSLSLHLSTGGGLVARFTKQ